MRPHAAGFESVQKIPREEAKKRSRISASIPNPLASAAHIAGRRGKDFPAQIVDGDTVLPSRATPREGDSGRLD